ncbi:MAG: radical SAM protein [Verrucomicrobiota bacterium]|jgi:MoaA/NifB/PqqE/SkfB family radical SAM enzyme
MNPLRLASLPLTIARNRQGEPTAPRFLTFIVTFTCNARCVMCDSWRKPSPEELTTAEIAAIFEQLPPLDMVRLTGGEPFVRPDLLDIARLVRQHLVPLVLHVTTNGFLTRRIVEFCEQRPRDLPLNLLVSLDGTEARHNEVRGRDTAWETATDTLCALAPRQRELNLSLGVNQTVLDAGDVEEYRRLRDCLQPLGIRHHVVIAYRNSATYSVAGEGDAAPTQPGGFGAFGELPTRALRELLDLAEADLVLAPLPERVAKRYYLRGLWRRLLDHASEPQPPCVALRSHLRLYPNGDVPTCQFNSRRVGNLRRQRFAEVGAGGRAGTQRDWVRRCAGCWAECEVLPNALYSGDLWRSLLPAGGTRRPTT